MLMTKIYIILLLAAIPVLSQAQQELVGSWELTLNESLQNMQSDRKARYDSLPSQVREQISQSFNNREFTFAADSTVIIQWNRNGIARQVQGTWNFNAGEGKLTIIPGTGDHLAREYQVTEVTSSVMILKMNDQSGLFQELHLKRKS
jgi:hypothetical protein